MNAPTEEMFRDVYSAYDREHAARREALMAALPLATPARVDIRLRGRWLTAFTAVAAVLIVALGIAGLEMFRPTPAYGLDGLRERLQALHSLYVKGWVYQRMQTEFGTATVRFPVERYYERPAKYYMVSYGFSLGGNDDLKRVSHVTVANDGSRTMLLSADTKQAVLGPSSDTLGAELRVENGLQVDEAQQLLNGVPKDFERVGAERLDGEMRDIYESKPIEHDDFLRRVWVNPKTGLPVRVVGLHRSGAGEEVLVYEYTVIRANSDPPAKLFAFDVPDGYKVTDMKEAPAVQGIADYSSGAAGDKHGATWAAMKLDDNAVLLCWSQWNDDNGEKKWFHNEPRFVLQSGKDRECTEHRLYETTSGELRWRWSIVTPSDKKAVGSDSLAVKFSDPKDGSVTLSIMPLAFPEERLENMVTRVQRRSLEETGDFSALMPLVKLREALRKE
jgi:outer membrane lipoprotein-sorting protein